MLLYAAHIHFQRLELLKQQEKKGEQSTRTQVRQHCTERFERPSLTIKCYIQITCKMTVSVAAGNIANRVVEE